MKRTTLAILLLTMTATLAAPRLRAADMPKGFRGDLPDGSRRRRQEDRRPCRPRCRRRNTVAPGRRRAIGLRGLHAHRRVELSPAVLHGRAQARRPCPRLEKITDKAKVMEALKASFENLRQAVMNTSDADLEKPAKMFGRDTMVRGVTLHDREPPARAPRPVDRVRANERRRAALVDAEEVTPPLPHGFPSPHCREGGRKGE